MKTWVSKSFHNHNQTKHPNPRQITVTQKFSINRLNWLNALQFKTMFQIKLMRSEDFVFATELTNTMDWNMAIEDFQFMSYLEPCGCFVLFDDSQPIGMATCNSYGKVGWFGNLIVREEYRSKGAGSQLVKHAIGFLQGKGVETIGLYAYPNLIGFYRNLGFRYDEIFSMQQSTNLKKTLSLETLSIVGTKHFQQIAEFDRKCFGGDRQKLLESIILQKNNLSYHISKNDEVIGYLAATVYEKMAWIGPLICQENNLYAAITLLKEGLSKLTGSNVYLALPKKEIALADILSTAGFKEDFCVARMFFGPKTVKNCIYLAESLERG
jgi:ribosomal protein S18 acetylase RimI-like enzyme